MRNSHRTITITRQQEGKQSKATSSLFPFKNIAKLEMTQSNTKITLNKHRPPQWEQQSTTNQQKQNRRFRTDSNRHWGGGGFNAFYWYLIFPLDSVKNVWFAWRFPNYCNVISQRNNQIKLTHYDEIRKMAHDSHTIVKNLKLSHRGLSQRQVSATN